MLDRSFIFLPLKVGKRALFHCDVHKWYSFKIYWTGTAIMWMAWRRIALMYSQQTKTRFKKASIQLNVWNAFCIFPEESENEHVLNPECLGIWFSHQLYPCFSPDILIVHGLMERLPHVLTGWMDTLHTVSHWSLDSFFTEMSSIISSSPDMSTLLVYKYSFEEMCLVTFSFFCSLFFCDAERFVFPCPLTHQGLMLV